MAVDMFLVEVGGNDDFKAVAPHFLCQLYADLVGKMQCNLLRLDALIPVPGNTSTNCSISVQILRADGSFRAKRPEKSAGRKAADLDCGVTIRFSLSLWTAPYVYRLLCRFLRMSFFYPCPGVSPQRCLAHSLSERFSQGHIPFGRLFSFQFAPQLVSSEKGRKLTSSIINWELFAVCTKEFL